MIRLNKSPKFALLALISYCFAYTTFAANDSAVIDLSHTCTPFVKFTGTAPGASRFYDNDDLVNFIFPITVVLGTMGLESNVGGDCDLEFSTQNNFELQHTVIPTTGGRYTINYQGESFTQGNNPVLTRPCTIVATEISFMLNNNTLIGFDNRIPGGIFQDIINVIVTTQ